MKRAISFLPWLGALLLIAFLLLHFESDLLWKVEQNNLFLYTPLYFSEQMVVSGGFLSYVSCYFTQFFYHPWLGVLILCCWWLLLMWLVKRTFRIPDEWTVIALIPVAILLVANTCLGYWHYFMRLQGYFYAPTIGTVIGVGMLWMFRVLPKHLWTRLGWIVLVAAIGYPLSGAYALAAVLLMAVWIWRLSNNRVHNAILTGAALICIVAVPLICYRYVYNQTYIADIWTTALPVFTAGESFPVFYTPYCLSGAFFLLMVVFFHRAPLTKPLKPLYRWAAQGLLAAALVLSVWHCWYKDSNFHHELAMQHCIDEADWQGVTDESQKQASEEPTHAIVMMHNLALSRQGRQLEEIYNFPNGNKRSDTPIPFNILYHVFGKLLYYQYGMLNDCHRRCIEDGVEYGWRVELFKYMVRCSLLSGEKQAAQKILDQLRHTMYHHKWAEEMQALLDSPKQQGSHPETAFVTHMLHYRNALGGDGGDIEGYIMSQLAVQDANDDFFQQQAVLATLWLGDQQRFWQRFGGYVHLHPQGPIPRIFQEAAYLFGKRENRADIDRAPFDKGVKDTYKAFMRENAKFANQSIETARTALYPFYSNTYFYDYTFNKTNKQH